VIPRSYFFIHDRTHIFLLSRPPNEQEIKVSEGSSCISSLAYKWNAINLLEDRRLFTRSEIVQFRTVDGDGTDSPVRYKKNWMS
jgi:hypothetical protein